MELKKLGKVAKGQDGAVFGGMLFRFDATGTCFVYKIGDLSEESTPLCQFVLDKADRIAPHSNSVAFGCARYEEGDEFPLLYSNIYNNYAKADDPLKGVTCVYRLQRQGDSFRTTLVQLIEIGFTDDPVWCSGADVRPYGNFAIDKEKGLYYAFTMRDASQTMEYFSFPMPALSDGIYDETLGVKRVTLCKKDILEQFSCPYQQYIQGAICHKGIIYSLEGFTDSAENPPAIRLVDTAAKKQTCLTYFKDLGTTVEPELIDFEDGICYYADHEGTVYTLGGLL